MRLYFLKNILSNLINRPKQRPLLFGLQGIMVAVFIKTNMQSNYSVPWFPSSVSHRGNWPAKIQIIIVIFENFKLHLPKSSRTREKITPLAIPILNCDHTHTVICTNKPLHSSKPKHTLMFLQMSHWENDFIQMLRRWSKRLFFLLGCLNDLVSFR